MEKNLTRKEVEDRLRAKSESIRDHYRALGDEVSDTGHSIVDRIKQNPFFGLLGSLLAGLLVGLVLGGIGKSRRRSTRSRQRLLEQALDQSRQFRKKRDDTGDEDDAADEPVSIVFLPEQEKSSSIWRSLMWFGLNMALRQGLIKAQTYISERMDLFGNEDVPANRPPPTESE